MVPAAPAGAKSYAVDAVSHRLAVLPWLESPNADDRPLPTDISLLVVHAISLPPGELGTARNRGYIDDLFLNRLDPSAHPYFAGVAGRTVSAHVCIFRDGSATQYVPFDRRAWHAGESFFDGRSRCNDFSIGIELEGCDEQAFTDAQYRTLALIANAVQRAYPAITRERIVGHADIAPARKTDPGPYFDWPRLHLEMEFPR
jgi:AmpD protein